MNDARRAHILLVEDEPSLVLTLSDRLQAEGYDVTAVADGDRGWELAADGGHDLIVLDVALPGRSGLDLCRDLRRHGLDVPILMLTARSGLTDKVVGLKLGADDYLSKPFEMLELMARIEALLRRARGVERGAGIFRFADVVIDRDEATVTRAGIALPLSSLELKLLLYLVENPRRVLSRDELLDEVWGYEATPTTRTVDVHIAGLRQKLEPVPSHPRHIQTVHGAGYRFVPDS